MGLYLAMVFIAGSCQSEGRLTKASLDFAGENATELRQVLNHYVDDEEKLSSAIFLIDNLPHWYSYQPSADMDSIENMLHVIANNKDIWYFKELSNRNWKSWDCYSRAKIYDSHVITFDYLIENIETAHKYKSNRRWNKDLPQDLFNNFLLPFRIGDEPLSDWRALYQSHYGPILDSLYFDGDDSLEAAQIIFNQLEQEGFKYNVCAHWPHRKATDLLHGNAGPCKDECDRQIYALRSVGIPCAVDTYFTSPEHDTSHQWVMVWDNKRNRFTRFGPKMVERRDSAINNPDVKKCKVYRFMSGIQMDRYNWISDSECVQSAIRNFYIKDVTDAYFNNNTLKVEISNPDKRQVLLGVFSPSGWKAVDYAVKSEKDRAIFENVESGIIYICLIPSDNNYGMKPCSYPFVFNRDGNIEFLKPSDKTELVSLNRKMPFMPWLYTWFSQGVGRGVVELSHSKDFNYSIKGAMLPDTISTNFHAVTFPPTKTRYVRFSVPGDKEIVLGQIEVYKDSACRKRVGCRVITEFDQYHHPENVTDGDVLSFFVAPKECRSIVLQLDQDTVVEAVGIIPRNNDNFVWPDHFYSLMYFKSPDDGWVETTRVLASDRTIQMDVPKGALLWLRDLTKGIEEACFIWKDGKQIFVKDI